MASLEIIRVFHFNEFFELMFHFFHEVGGGVYQQDSAAAGEILLVLMGDQFLDSNPPSVQDIHDPVQN